MSDTDRIEKQIILRAPRQRVWRALTDATEFGTWFRVQLDGPFVVGNKTIGTITSPGYEHLQMQMRIEKIDRERFQFAYRWNPYAIDPSVDYSKEEPTLVEFQLDEAPEGTRLTVTESGFDKLPASRRDEAFRMNSGGWAAQLTNIERHVTT